MALLLLSPEDAARRIAQRTGRPHGSAEALSDLLRAEVHARKHAPKAATISRAARLLGHITPTIEERLDEVCNALEREGDFVLAPGGLLFATPTRVVVTSKSARVFSSVPTRALAAALDREVSTLGATRTVASTGGLAERISKVGGVVVTPEAWAGLDRTPNADATFLARLDQRLEWESSGAGSLEKEDALEWRAWQATGEGMRWRRSDTGRLWWARTRFGGHHRAWTSGASPTKTSFVVLSADDADRARFALSREVEGASVLRLERAGKRVTLKVPGWLPRQEYRWLSLHAALAPDSKGTLWEIAADDEPQVTKLLAERLGLVAEAP
jgi:hypothetical protein